MPKRGPPAPDNGTNGFRARLDKPLAVQLDESGIVAADIDMIALSHLHWDHAGNANAFAGTATWLAREAQVEYGFRESAAAMGFDPKTYGALEDGPTQIIAGDYDVFGEGSDRLALADPGESWPHGPTATPVNKAELIHGAPNVRRYPGQQ